jgi:hypothetical protein
MSKPKKSIIEVRGTAVTILSTKNADFIIIICCSEVKRPGLIGNRDTRCKTQVMNSPILKIVSGGQTGADRAGLD